MKLNTNTHKNENTKDLHDLAFVLTSIGNNKERFMLHIMCYRDLCFKTKNMRLSRIQFIITHMVYNK